MNETLVIEAVRKTVTVDCAVEEAFRVFTADAQSWWPTDTHSIHGDEVKEIVFEEREGGEVYEVSADGERRATGRRFSPGSRRTGSCSRGTSSSARAVATEVEVRFPPEDGATRVELEHRGWEALDERGRREARQLRHRLGSRARLLLRERG